MLSLIRSTETQFSLNTFKATSLNSIDIKRNSFGTTFILHFPSDFCLLSGKNTQFVITWYKFAFLCIGNVSRATDNFGVCGYFTPLNLINWVKCQFHFWF